MTRRAVGLMDRSRRGSQGWWGGPGSPAWMDANSNLQKNGMFKTQHNPNPGEVTSSGPGLCWVQGNSVCVCWGEKQWQ